MQKITYSILGLLIGISGSFLFAQEYAKESKGDSYYTATSTAYKILSSEELLKAKEDYNNTQEIVEQIKITNERLRRIELYVRN